MCSRCGPRACMYVHFFRFKSFFSAVFFFSTVLIGLNSLRFCSRHVYLFLLKLNRKSTTIHVRCWLRVHWRPLCCFAALAILLFLSFFLLLSNTPIRKLDRRGHMSKRVQWLNTNVNIWMFACENTMELIFSTCPILRRTENGQQQQQSTNTHVKNHPIHNKKIAKWKWIWKKYPTAPFDDCNA